MTENRGDKTRSDDTRDNGSPGARQSGSNALVGVVYFAILLALGILGGRQAASQFLTHFAPASESIAQTESAISFQPENPYAYEALGVLLARNNDDHKAAESFRHALTLRPNDYVLWLRLGDAEMRMANFDESRDAFAKAINLAPRYSEPRFSIGQIFLKLGNTAEAFRNFSTAASMDPARYPAVLDLARVTFSDDPVSVENAVTADTVDSRVKIARYFIEHYWMTERLLAFLTGNDLTVDEKDAFTIELIDKENFAAAREVWISRLGEDRSVFDQPVYDGGFEKIAGSDPGGLGWQIDQKISGVSVARDRTTVHSGENALNVSFSGNVELKRSIVSQLVLVIPKRRYVLSFFLHAEGMLSAELPVISISRAANRELIAKSIPLSDTHANWIKLDIQFDAPEEGVVLISLERPSCSVTPCPLVGEMSLDDLSVEPVAGT